MKLVEILLPEFDQEMATTRRTLERVPDGKSTWKPHEKSMSMGRLAGHIAEMPAWVVETLQKDELDVNPPGGSPYQPFDAATSREALEKFDANVKNAREALAGASDEELFKRWTLLSGGQEIVTMPKLGVVRAFVISHLVHHRAQLGVYLRLNNVPVPAVYGPSADEQTF
jgi:uncharacterized damage-inducible protein DinB